MEKLIEIGSDYMPYVEFCPNGRLKMEGKIIPEDAEKTFAPWIDYIKNLFSEEVSFDINLMYFNTASSKKLMELLRHLDANNNIKKARVNWHYEEGDEDSLEVAEIFEETLLKVDFHYFEYQECE